MSRNKIRKFDQNRQRNNVIEPGKDIFSRIKGNWRQDFFRNQKDLVVELGCGKGEYTVGLAEKFPERNFIGVDIKGDRIWVGSGKAIERKLENVAFLRIQMQALPDFFVKDEVDEIWLTFPDPRPKKRDIKRRLTYPRYMEYYSQILKPAGWFRFKTDNTLLFDYTLDLINERELKVAELEYTYDLYASPLLDDHHGITTKYEKLFSEQGETIKYMKFKFDHKKG